MAISGDIRIRIKASTWRFRWSLSTVQVWIWWWDLSARLKTSIREAREDLVAWARPGLAPELNSPWGCPWLTRTAGQPITRPVTLAMVLGVTNGQLAVLARAAQAATEAFRQFGVSMSVAMKNAAAAANIRVQP